MSRFGAEGALVFSAAIAAANKGATSAAMRPPAIAIIDPRGATRPVRLEEEPLHPEKAGNVDDLAREATGARPSSLNPRRNSHRRPERRSRAREEARPHRRKWRRRGSLALQGAGGRARAFANRRENLLRARSKVRGPPDHRYRARYRWRESRAGPRPPAHAAARARRISWSTVLSTSRARIHRSQQRR